MKDIQIECDCKETQDVKSHRGYKASIATLTNLVDHYVSPSIELEVTTDLPVFKAGHRYRLIIEEMGDDE